MERNFEEVDTMLIGNLNLKSNLEDVDEMLDRQFKFEVSEKKKNTKVNNWYHYFSGKPRLGFKDAYRWFSVPSRWGTIFYMCLKFHWVFKLWGQRWG